MVSALDLLVQLLDVVVQLGDLVLEGTHLVCVVFNHPIELVLSCLLLFSSGLRYCFLKLGLPLFNQCLLLLFKLVPQGVLRVKLLRQQLIVLLVVLLYVIGQLLGMCLLKRIYGFVVLPEVVDLLLELLHSLVEASLDVHHLCFQIRHFLFVITLQVLLLFQQGILVLLKLSLTIFLFCGMLLFYVSDFLFPLLAILGPQNLLLLLRDDPISTV